MTKSEEEFFVILCNIFQDKCYVFPQIHLSTLLNHRIKGQKWLPAFQHINGKSVDFVLCSKNNLRPICAIELDDHTHTHDKRMKRDKEVERIFDHAKFPLVRFDSYRTSSNKEIVSKISEALHEL